jgi:hypothetical protein
MVVFMGLVCSLHAITQPGEAGWAKRAAHDWVVTTRQLGGF